MSDAQIEQALEFAQSLDATVTIKRGGDSPKRVAVRNGRVVGSSSHPADIGPSANVNRSEGLAAAEEFVPGLEA